MNKTQFNYFRVALVALLALVISLSYAQAVLAQTTSAITPPNVPNNLKAPTGERPILKVSAKGVQIYTCSASTANSTGFEWVFKAPEAELFNEQNAKVGKHYAGPTWEATDGSKVVGEAKERADAPGGKSIPWLLLKSKSNEGNGLMSKVSSVQRVETVAGLAPAAADCTQARKDTEVRVDYSATYYFYQPASASMTGAPATGHGGGATKEEESFTGTWLIIWLGLAITAGLAGSLMFFVSYDKGKPKY